MLFTGPELRELLSRSGDEIELRNQCGRCCRILSRSEALGLDPDLFVGIGNRRRVKALRPRVSTAILNAGSRTTQRMKDGFGLNISHPLIREHRPQGKLR